jgi:hypothetical protein
MLADKIYTNLRVADLRRKYVVQLTGIHLEQKVTFVTRMSGRQPFSIRSHCRGRQDRDGGIPAFGRPAEEKSAFSAALCC